MVSWSWVWLKQDWRSFSSEEFSAWVRITESDEAPGRRVCVAWGAGLMDDWGCSWDRRCSKERSVSWMLSLVSALPAETIALVSSYGFDVFD